MRANTSRGLRLAFDEAAEVYDAGRPRFDASLIAGLLEAADLKPGARVLEVGAGTGQLTGGLVEAGLDVTAMEPGPRMAHLLRARHPNVPVVQQPFEDYTPPDAFTGVLSANAFHWLDPAVSYRKAAQMLRPGGSLCLIWNFPILADVGLQARLNREVFTGEFEGLRRDPQDYRAGLEQLLGAGRDELAASGCFEPPWWWLAERRSSLSAAAYLDLLASFANTVCGRDTLEARLHGLDAVEVVDHVYMSAARARA